MDELRNPSWLEQYERVIGRARLGTFGMGTQTPFHRVAAALSGTLLPTRDDLRRMAEMISSNMGGSEFTAAPGPTVASMREQLKSPGMDLYDILRDPQVQNMLITGGLGGLRGARLPETGTAIRRPPIRNMTWTERRAPGRAIGGQGTRGPMLGADYLLDDYVGGVLRQSGKPAPQFRPGETAWIGPLQWMRDDTGKWRSTGRLQNPPGDWMRSPGDVPPNAPRPDLPDEGLGGGQMTAEPPSGQLFEQLPPGTVERIAGMSDDELIQLIDRTHEDMNQYVPNSPQRDAHELIFKEANKERWRRIQKAHGTIMAKRQPESFEGPATVPSFARPPRDWKEKVEHELLLATKRANTKEVRNAAKADALRVPPEEGKTGPLTYSSAYFKSPAVRMGRKIYTGETHYEALYKAIKDNNSNPTTAQKIDMTRINDEAKSLGFVTHGGTFVYGPDAEKLTGVPWESYRYAERGLTGPAHPTDIKGLPTTGSEPINLPYTYREFSDNGLLFQWQAARKALAEAPAPFKPRLTETVRMMEHEMKRRGFIPPDVKF